MHTRVAHARGVFGRWWGFMNLTWTALSSADTLVSKYASDAFKAEWNSWWITPKWGWAVWAIGILVISFGFAFGYSFRLVKSQESETLRLSSEVDRLSKQHEGPEIWLIYGGSNNVDERQVGIKNIHGGTAKNIQLLEMTDGKLISDKSEIIPLLTVEQWRWVTLNVKVADPEFDFGHFSINSLLIKAERPIKATVHHEDANGAKYKTVFEITPDRRAWTVNIRQIERVRC